MTALDLVLIVLMLIAWGLYSRVRRENIALQQSLDQHAHGSTGTSDRLRELEARAVALSDVSPQALLVLEAQGTIAYANAHAINLLGQTPTGQTVIAATRSHEIDALARAVLESRRPDERPISWDARPFYARAMPIEGGGAVLALEDQSHLQRIGRVRRDFVANVSHELRTPLASIRLSLETLLAGAINDPDVSTRLLNQVISEVDALTQLAQELLDLSMIESGQMSMRLSPTNLREVVEEQLSRFEPQADQKQIVLNNQVRPDLSADIDRSMIGRALGNLIHNALKFTPAGGQVTINAAPAAHDVTLSVADTGSGIPREELSRIFERFYKVDHARGKGGTGLGLSIARHVVEAHAGRIWAESAPGKGATFYFTLPASPRKG